MSCYHGYRVWEITINNAVIGDVSYILLVTSFLLQGAFANIIFRTYFLEYEYDNALYTESHIHVSGLILGLRPANERRHQAITWTNFDLSLVRSGGIHLRPIAQEMLKISILHISLKTTYSRLQLHFPGAIELIYSHKSWRELFNTVAVNWQLVKYSCELIANPHICQTDQEVQ